MPAGVPFSWFKRARISRSPPRSEQPWLPPRPETGGPRDSVVTATASQLDRRIQMADEITLTMSKADAEVVLGVLSSERHNPDVDAVCEAHRSKLDEKLAEAG